jgi:hypothetical protein
MASMEWNWVSRPVASGRRRWPRHPGEPRRPVQWTALTAACAVLTMLANSMMPEAFERGGNSVGLLTVLGYLVAAALTAVQ